MDNNTFDKIIDNLTNQHNTKTGDSKGDTYSQTRGWIGVLQRHTDQSILSTDPKILANQIIQTVLESDYLCMNGTPRFNRARGQIDRIFRTLPEERRTAVMSEIQKQTQDEERPILYNAINSIYNCVNEQDTPNM